VLYCLVNYTFIQLMNVIWGPSVTINFHRISWLENLEHFSLTFFILDKAFENKELARFNQNSGSFIGVYDYSRQARRVGLR